MLLTLSLITVVKYRVDMRVTDDRVRRIEDARKKKPLENALKEEA